MQIVRVRMGLFRDGGGYGHHEHIIAVEIADGRVLDVAHVIAAIRAGEYVYTLVGGHQARVHPMACRNCRTPFITTSPDGYTPNNLDNLPRF